MPLIEFLKDAAFHCMTIFTVDQQKPSLAQINNNNETERRQDMRKRQNGHLVDGSYVRTWHMHNRTVGRFARMTSLDIWGNYTIGANLRIKGRICLERANQNI